MTLALIQRAEAHHEATAIITAERAFTYSELLEASARTAAALLRSGGDLCAERIAFLVPPGFDYVATQWGIWRAGGVAVPLAVQHPPAELEHVICDAQVSAVVAHPDFADRVSSLIQSRSLPLFLTTQLQDAAPQPLPNVPVHRRAMILYTSGTTSKPKGVVTTHANNQAQTESLIEAWDWTAGDHILHVLPLHHVHGIINVLTCALWAGARCEFAPRFDAASIWDRFTRGDLTLFMAVPTIYAKLIAAWQEATPERRAIWSASCRSMRLMVSGSAALPVSTLEQWHSISGHVLLERYGMTEIGMALSNPLHGERVPGHVGTPVPKVEVRLVDEQGQPVGGETGKNAHPTGEIEVRGPNVFLEYWQCPEATQSSFHDGWFRTGDMAVIEDGSYRILGRKNVDIIKSGGYKLSALEIEEVLRTHPDVRECAVVGIPDQEWGERVAACVVIEAGASLTTDSLRDWAKERLASYKAPTRLLVVEQLPRNVMGKVQKPAVAAMFSQPNS